MSPLKPKSALPSSFSYQELFTDQMEEQELTWQSPQELPAGQDSVTETESSLAD
jgi:hypothetical protein